jgi:hypothetical protein
MISCEPAQGIVRAAALAATLLLTVPWMTSSARLFDCWERDGAAPVSSATGPEAGVWVIAETTELPTKLVKIVVTDDRGRYVLPQLPKANYDIWVRGYGLVDSPKTRAAPGSALGLKAVLAANEKAAAEYYPAQYWYSMLAIPEKGLFPGRHGRKASNAISS